MRVLNLIFIVLLNSILNISSEKKMDFGSFSIETAENWNYIKVRGIDSFVGKIALDKNDTIYFDYGMYSSSLKEDLGLIITKDSVFTEVKNDKLNDTLNPYIMKFYAKRDTLNLEYLYKTKYSFEIINNLKAKIVTPKKVGTGLTGVYFENTSSKSKGMKFEISGNNLSAENQKLFLKAINTIKFKD